MNSQETIELPIDSVISIDGVAMTTWIPVGLSLVGIKSGIFDIKTPERDYAWTITDQATYEVMV